MSGMSGIKEWFQKQEAINKSWLQSNNNQKTGVSEWGRKKKLKRKIIWPKENPVTETV